MNRVAEMIQTCLTRDERLFRRGDDEFVALVSRSENSDLWTLAKQVREVVRRHPLKLDGNVTFELHVSTHGIAAPSDEVALRGLLASGHAAANLVSTSTRTQVH